MGNKKKEQKQKQKTFWGNKTHKLIFFMQPNNDFRGMM